MKRRTFSTLLGAGMARPALSQTSPADPKRLRAGVITEPEGAHLNYFFESLAQAEEVGSVALSDPSGESEALARKLLGPKLAATYKDRGALLRKEKPELAVVSLEAVSSPPAIDAALDAGCHVLTEKPACVRIEDFERLNRKAKAKNRHLVLALANRMDAVMLEARRMVGEGKIGKVYGVEVHLIADQTRLTRPPYHKSWRAQKARSGGGHLMWLGLHWLDLAMYITGTRVTSVAAFTANVGGQPLDTEDAAVVALRLDNGALGTLTSAYYLDKGYDSHLKVWGSHGWLHVRKHTEVPLEWYSTKDPQAEVRRFEEPKKPTGYMYPAFIRSVARACLGLEPIPLTGDEGLFVLKTVFACYRAAESGQTQRLS